MKNLFDAERAAEIKGRLAHLRPDSERRWGTMSATQMVAHCVIGSQMATGEHNPPRVFIGRVLGRLIKPLALRDDAPMKKNSPTVPSLVVKGDPDFEQERARLQEIIDRFATSGPRGCTTHPHPFFGLLTPDEWAVLMYKHLDHHLRQFGA